MPTPSTITQPAVPKQDVVQLYRRAVASEMSLDTLNQKIETYLNRTSVTHQLEEEQFQQQRQQQEKTRIPKTARTVLPVALILIGLFLVGNAVWPIASYYLFAHGDIQVSSLLSPVPHNELADIIPRVVVQAQTAPQTLNALSGSADSQDTSQPTILDNELDYTNLANWFPNPVDLQNTKVPNLEYKLEIPAVDVHNARVIMGGTNLDRSLIQYPGTALPGQLGDPVIFGHSVLRQFYNPSEENPRRYFSIFSKILTLKKGDKIFLSQGNITYTYVVKDKLMVKPEDTAILEQDYSRRLLKLITCAPEGTEIERGIVEAELAQDE